MTNPGTKSSRGKWLALAVLLALAAFAYVFDSDWLRPPLQRLVSAKTGRAFSAEHLKLDFSWPLRAHLRGVRFANPDWAREHEMLLVQEADLTIRLLPLLHGAVVLPDVRLVKPILDIETSDDGRGNWELSRRPVDPKAPPGAPPEIGKLAIDEGVVLVHVPVQNTDLSVTVSTVQQGKLAFRAQGTFRTRPLEASGTTGSVLSILDREPFPIDATFRVGPTHGTAAGGLSGALGPGTDLRVELAGETLAELFHVLGITLPDTPPYRLAANVKREPDLWIVSRIDGHVGDSDLGGSFRMQMQNGRPRLDGTLTSEQLDLDDIGVAVGAPPRTGPGQTASPRQRQQAREQEKGSQVVPEKPFDVGRLRTMDADVEYSAHSFRGGGRVLDNLRAHVLLANGVLKLQPLDFGIGGGDVAGTVDVDGREDRMVLATDMEFRRIELKKLFPTNARLAKSPAGVLGGRANIKTSGNTPKELLGSADGRVGLASSGGQVSQLLLAFTELDAAKITTQVFRGDKTTELRCAVADVDVQDGVLKSRTIVLDSKDTNVHVDGQVNLRDESLDVTVNSMPKKIGAPSLRSPIHVDGHLKNPQIRPDKKLFIRGGIAAALGAAAGPLAALVPLIETGHGKDANCRELQANVEKHLQEKIPEAGNGAIP